MGFFIKCCRGAEIAHAGESVKISVAQIKQVPGDTTRVSEAACKGADEVRRTTFAATTDLGTFIWHVFFSTGDSGECIDDVELVSAPTGAVVRSNPDFRIQDSDG